MERKGQIAAAFNQITTSPFKKKQEGSFETRFDHDSSAASDPNADYVPDGGAIKGNIKLNTQ